MTEVTEHTDKDSTSSRESDRLPWIINRKPILYIITVNQNPENSTEGLQWWLLGQLRGWHLALNATIFQGSLELSLVSSLRHCYVNVSSHLDICVGLPFPFIKHLYLTLLSHSDKLLLFFHLSDLNITAGKEKCCSSLLWECSFSWLIWLGCSSSEALPLLPHNECDAEYPCGYSWAHETMQGCAVCLRQLVCLWFHKAGCHWAKYKHDISRGSGERTQKQCLSSETFPPPRVGAALSAWCILLCLLKTEVSTISLVHLLFKRLGARYLPN